MWNNNRMQTKQNHPYRIWQRVVSALACMVMLITSYGGMILPVKAIEQTAYCGHEEHQHSQECYEKRLICGHEETTGEPHVHTAECYQQQRVLICGLEETPGHIHDESCVQKPEGPTCGKEAGEGGHTHGESCYETRDVLTCEIHVHTEACYEEVLVCDQEEHTHSLSCFSDPEADVESETVWENSVSGVALTGVWAEDVIAIAESQLGYTESERNYTVTGDGARKGYTRYGDWYGDPYGDWSAMFVSFCLYYAGISRQSVPYASDCAGWVGTLAGEAWGLYRSMEGNSPQKGDIVFLDTDADGSADQAGLVASVSGDSLRVIVGDSENSVRTVSCAMSSDRLLGFAALPENPSNLTTQVNDAALVSLEGDDGAAPADGAGDLTITLGQTLNVDVPAGEIVTIPFVPEYTHEYVFCSTGSSDTYGYIYDASGKQLASNDNSGGNYQFLIRYNLTAGRTYNLGVKWDNSTSSGTIPVSLTYGSTHFYTQNESGQYVCGCGETAQYTITLDQTLNVDVPWGAGTVIIPFTPEFTHQYIFRSTGSGDTYGYIYDAEGNQLASDDDSGGNNQFQITYTLTAGQVYYLGVKWRFPRDSGTIPVLLTYGIHSYTKNESGQYVCTACGETAEGDKENITLGKPLCLEVAAGETVRIPFTPEITHQYVFKSTGNGDTYGYIYDAGGNQLASNDDSGGNSQFKITYTLTAGQPYYLGVKWINSSSSGIIPVSLTYDSNHSYTKNESGEYICDCGKKARYAITLDQILNISVGTGETVMFPFIPEYTHEYIFRSTGSRDTVGYIYDADGKCIVSDNDSGGNNQFQITYTLTAGQIYYFGAKFYSSSSGGTIPVLLMYGKHSCTKNENGQYVCTACGKVAPSVALGERLDVDVAAWETMEIPFIPEYTHAYIFRSTGSGGTFGYINDADGNRLTSDNDSGGNSQFQITYTLTAGQTYYLGVKWDSSTSSGTIPVLLTYGAHSFTKNESGQYVCTCGETAEVDKLDITLDQTLGVNVEAGETVTISFTPEVTHEYIFRSIGSGDTQGYIYDGYGTHPSGSNHNSKNGQFETTCTLTAGQTYYLRVKWKDPSKSGMIPVRLTYGDHIYTRREDGRHVCTCGEPAQYTIKLDQTVNVDVALGEKVRIPFVPEITHQYVFCSTGSGAPYGYIYDAAGKQIASNGSSGGNKQFKITCTLTAGQTYYLGAGWPNYGDSGTIPVLLTYGAHSYAKNESGQYVCTCGATRLEEGTCGDGVTWRIEGDRLIISGNGAMENYSYSSNVPWSEMKREITEIVVEEGVTSIGNYAFNGCSALTSVTIQNGVTSIGNFAFEGCSALTSVTIPDSVTSIGNYAFEGCSALTSVTIPDSVTSIGHFAFEDCSALTSVTIPDSVTSIGNYAFEGCRALASVTIPDSVTSIGNSAFAGCSALASVKIPNGVTSIEGDTFRGCDSLKSVTIPDSVTSIGGDAFRHCSSLTSVTIPDSVTSIGSSAFEYCSSLTSVTIPDGVTSIANYTFEDCSSLTSVTIPDSVTSIGWGAFRYCSSLSSVTIPDGVTSIESSTFKGCSSLSSVTIPDSVTSIGFSAFEDCSSLTSVTIPDSVTSIAYNVFQNCGALKSVTIPKGVTSIGQNPFAGCSGFETLVWDAENAHLTDSNTSMVSDFTLVIGKNVNSIDEESFAALKKMGMREIRFESPNYFTLPNVQQNSLGLPLSSLAAGDYYVDSQGVLYRIHDGAASLAYWPPELTECTVPATLPGEDGTEIPVTGVDGYAFAAAKTLREITFAAPESITELRDFAFANAAALERINGKNSQEEVLGTFPQATAGVQMFENTAISHLDSITGDMLEQVKENLELKISTARSSRDTAGEGIFHYYTGETATTSVTISNHESVESPEGTTVRIVYKFDSAGASLNYKPGTYTLKAKDSDNTYQMTLKEDSLTNCYVIDIERPRVGDTLAINFIAAYPSPGSAGGNASIWGGILTKEEAQGSALIAPSGSYHRINWCTKPDAFPVTKTLSSANSAVMRGDGNGGALIDGLSYRITMSRAAEDTLEGIGKDFVTSVQFRDVLTLPEGARLAPELVQAVQEKSYTIIHKEDYRAGISDEFQVNNDCFLSIIRTKTTDIMGYSLEIDEDGKLVLNWTVQNADLNTEIDNLSFTCAFSGKYIRIPKPDPEKTYTVTNRVTATQHYMYSADQAQSDECTVTIGAKEGKLNLTKERSTGNVNTDDFGSDRLTWKITAENPEVLPYEELAFIEDELPADYWLTGNQLSALFQADADHQLTVTISRATLCTPHTPQKVTGIDGVSTGSTSLRNTGSDTPYNGLAYKDPDVQDYETAKIILTWGSGGTLLLTVGESEPQACEVDGAAIQAALDRQGFLVTSGTIYKLIWDRRDENGKARPLAGGESIVKEIPCTAKDTFMRLAHRDEENYYPDPSVYAYNKAYAYGENQEKLQSADESIWLYREFSLVKGRTWNRQTEDTDKPIGQGDAATYSLTVQHKGNGRYDVLPLTDRMTGGQALLVPKEKNQGADWAENCETVILKEGEYYLLTQEGTYSHVWTSDTQMAETVTVTKNDSGFDTLIKWYFMDYAGNRTDTVFYQAYVCPNQAVPGATTYALNNDTWLNDHATHRLHDDVGWWGSLVGFDKKIVESVEDKGEGMEYSQIHEGETVTYRLLMEGYMDTEGEPVPVTLTGSNMHDALPLSIDSYRWSKDNVQVFYQTESENYHVVNGDHWYIDTAEGTNQQLLKWKDDFSITFRGKAYIYVTLAFPEGQPWQDYSARYGTLTLVNTYHALNTESSVTHDLAIPAQVRLQKGVYSTGYYYIDGVFDDPNYRMKENWTPDCRYYYNNDDAGPRFVRYYVSLYNGGKTNLYLTDMQDRLPRGFTLWSCDRNSKYWDEYAQVLQDNRTKASYKKAGITTSTRKMGDTQFVTFHFDKIEESYPIQYDETRGMCYLAPGEAIKFAYICRTNQAADTDTIAENTISMPYYNYNGGGVEIDTGSSTVVQKSDIYSANDGGCELWNNGQAQNAGLNGGTTDTQWLTSQVKVVRGGIKPGITKALTSKTDINGAVIQNPISAYPTDTLIWTITAENGGTMAITDYVLTDVMQAPYGFSGKVNYQTYEPGMSSADEWPKYNYLFSIAPGNSDNMLRVSYQTAHGDIWTINAAIGGSWVRMPVCWKSGNSYSGNTVNIQLAVSRDESGNLVLSIHFPKEMAIPAGGKGVLTVSTARSDSVVENRQFVNTAFITPTFQTWDGRTNKGNMTTLDTPFTEGPLPTVRNSAQVATTYGYMTSSNKRVTETAHPENTAGCTDDPNYIALESRESEFDYTLQVENTTPKAMTKLILIDNLPEPGDHSTFLKEDPRGSEFKVSLAADPGFVVTVKPRDGQGTVLSSEQYTIEYASKTEFSKEDWNGTSNWSRELSADTRSVRLQILDEGGTLIPAGSTVSLSFTCVIDGEAEPGTTAWNSFGYHYGLKEEPVELEAAPQKIGVRPPSVPELVKRIVDHKGGNAAVEEDTTFSFLIYQSAPLTEAWETEETLTQTLTEQNISWMKCEATVKAGESASKPVRLDGYGLTWNRNQKYTVVELPNGEGYAFSRFEGANETTQGAVFTYDPAQNQVITCYNTSQVWSISLTKVNTSEEPLSGAVFALYSPVEQDGIPIPEGYQGLSIERTLQRDNKTWYLKAVDTTDEEGKLTFSELLREKYYLLEVKPPVGYELSDLSGQLLEQKYEVQGVYEVTVVNRREIDLPKTGGIGIDMLYTVGGILLIQCAVIFLLTGRNGRAAKKKGRNQP